MEDSYIFLKKKGWAGTVFWMGITKYDQVAFRVGEGVSCGAVGMQLPQTWAAAAALKMTHFHIPSGELT